MKNILCQCNAAKSTVFFKQWGGVRKWKSRGELDGGTYDDMPFTDIHPVLGAPA